MNRDNPKVDASANADPLHGKTLEAILTWLVEEYGFESLALKTHMNCFIENPSIKSSLKFLRSTPWARTKIENLYIYSIKKSKKSREPKITDTPE